MATLKSYKFGDYRLVPEQCRLYRLDGTGFKPIAGKPLEVLLYLVTQPRDKVVTNDEFRTKVWKAATLTPNTIAQQFTELNQILEEPKGKPKTYISRKKSVGTKFLRVVVEEPFVVDDEACEPPPEPPLEPPPVIKDTPRLRDFFSGLRGRQSVRVLALALVTLAALIQTGARTVANRPINSRLLILLADFESPGSQSSGLTREIFSRLHNSLDFTPGVEIRLLGRHIPWTATTGGTPSDTQPAAVEAKRAHARLVIWGDLVVSSTTATVAAHLLQINNNNNKAGEMLLNPTAPINEFNDFTFQKYVATLVEYLTTIAVAGSYYQGGAYRYAIPLFKSAISHVPPEGDPHISELYSLLGRACQGQGDRECALSAFSQAASIHRSVSTLFDKARALIWSGQQMPALDDLRSALAMARGADEQAPVRHLLAVTLWEIGQRENAVTEYQRFGVPYPPAVADFISLEASLGHPSLASRTFHAVDARILDYAPWLQYDEILIDARAGDFQAANKLLTNIPKSSKTNEYRCTLGLYTKVVTMEVLNACTQWIHDGTVVSVFAVGRSLVSPPTIPSPKLSRSLAHLARARAYLDLNDRSRARSDFDAAVREDALIGGQLQNCGQSGPDDHWAPADLDFRIDECSAILTFQPSNNQARLNRSKWLEFKGDLARARQDADLVANNDSNSGEALARLGDISLESGDQAAAKQYFIKAVFDHTATATAYGGFAKLNYLQGRFQQAIIDVANAVAMSPTWAEMYVIRGQSLQATKPANAVADYNRALNIDPWNKSTRAARASYYLDRDIVAATRDVQAIDPQELDGPTYRLLATVWERRGELAAARDFFEKSLTFDKEDAAALLGKGRVLREMHDNQAARAEFLRALTASKDAAQRSEVEKQLSLTPRQ